MNDNEKKIKEQRTIEATKRGLMGAGGKLGSVVKFLGDPITMHSEGGAFYDTNYLYDDNYEDPYELKGGTAEEIQQQMPYMGTDSNQEPLGYGWRTERSAEQSSFNTTQIGWHFDGLNRSIHLEIKYDGEKKELTAHYKGYIVYQEIAGELTAFAPGEWEEHVNKLHKVAKNIEKQSRKEEKEEKKETIQRNKLNWIRRVKERWGFN